MATKFETINKALYEADIFGTNCKENAGMEEEYAQVAEGIIEDDVKTLEEFFDSVDFWQFECFTKSMNGEDVFKAINHIL